VDLAAVEAVGVGLDGDRDMAADWGPELAGVAALAGGQVLPETVCARPVEQPSLTNLVFLAIPCSAPIVAPQ